MENIDITSQKPIIPSCLHWYNSSNILCNYMREVDYLKLILDNQAIIPRYVIEPLDYLSIPKLERFPQRRTRLKSARSLTTRCVLLKPKTKS